MASKWRVLSLREAGVSLLDCEHRTPPADGSGYPYIAIPQIKRGRLDLAEARRITPEHYRDWTRKAKPQANDVILSRRCNPGETAFVPPGLECALGQNLVLLRADGTEVFPPFLRWLVRGPEWWEQIGNFINVGAVFDSLKCADIPNFRLTIPPISEQKAIAHILGTLGDKIDLNRRMNETLEAMARAIFKSWFVDFDPVRAKIEGRDPGLPKPIANLFPDSFEESELGEIPRGWHTGSLLEQAELLSGGTPKTDESAYWDGDIPWASAKDVSQCGQPFLISTERQISERGLAESATRMIEPYSTVVVARGATTGRLAMFGGPIAMNQTCYALRSRCGCHFALYCQLREAIDNLVHSAHGSVFDTITTNTFQTSSVLLPDVTALSAYERIVTPIFVQICELEYQSQTLAAIRDALLPKLLSGELRVAYARRSAGL